MGRYHPEFEEPISEGIANFIVCVVEKIEESPQRDHNETVDEIIRDYSKNINKTNTLFSEDLINSVKEEIIIKIIEINSKYMQITMDTKQKLITCCIDYFIQEFSDIKDLEVDEEQFVQEKYPFLLKCLEQILISKSKTVKLEMWFEENLDHNWELLRDIWNDYKKDEITNTSLLKNAFKICGFNNLGKNIFINTLSKFPPIGKCTDLAYKDYMNEK